MWSIRFKFAQVILLCKYFSIIFSSNLFNCIIRSIPCWDIINHSWISIRVDWAKFNIIWQLYSYIRRYIVIITVRYHLLSSVIPFLIHFTYSFSNEVVAHRIKIQIIICFKNLRSFICIIISSYDYIKTSLISCIDILNSNFNLSISICTVSNCMELEQVAFCDGIFNPRSHCTGIFSKIIEVFYLMNLYFPCTCSG